MKTVVSTKSGRRGSAVIVVLALLVLIMAFMAGNNVTLRSLRQDMQIIEERQLRKYESLKPGLARTRPGQESSSVNTSHAPPVFGGPSSARP